MNHDRLIPVLRITLVAMLAASWAHLAETFALFYPPLTVPVLGWPVPMGAVAATAVDGTLYVLAETLGSIAAAKASGSSAEEDRPVGPVYVGLVALLTISALANLDASLTNLAGQRPLLGSGIAGVDWLDIARATIGMASFPLMGAYLTHSLTSLQAARARATGAAPTLAPVGAQIAGEVPRMRSAATVAPPERVDDETIAPPLTDAQRQLAERYVETAAKLGIDLDTVPPTEADEAIAKAQDGPRSERTVRRWRGWARDAGMISA